MEYAAKNKWMKFEFHGHASYCAILKKEKEIGTLCENEPSMMRRRRSKLKKSKEKKCERRNNNKELKSFQRKAFPWIKLEFNIFHNIF